MSSCAVCKRTDVGVINEALRQGMPVRVVAELHKVGKTTLGEHRKDCLRLADPRAEKRPAEAAPPAPPAPEKTRKVRRGKAADSGGQVSADSADKPRTEEAATDVPKFRPPRARPPRDPKLATSFEERVLVCADMIASGQFNGHRTVSWLSELWGVTRDAVEQYRRSGKVVARADRGDTSELLEDTLGSLRREEEDMERLAAWMEDLGQFQAAGRYRELKHKARAKFAEVAGLIVQRASVSLEGDPRIAGLWAVLHTALDELDRAREVFLAEVAKVTGGALPAVELPVPSAHVTGAVRKYEADLGARKGLAA